MRKPERLSSGRYKVRFRGPGISPDTGKLVQSSETFPTKRAAEDFARDLAALGPQGALDRLFEGEQQAAVPTLDTIAADHIALLTGIESGTRKTYERMWERVWAPRIGHLPANRVTADDIRRAVNQLGDTYSHKSLQNQRGLLSGVLGRAVDLGHLPKNPAKGIRLPRGQEADRVEMRIITPAEFAQVIDGIPEHYRPLVRFLYGTGCRWGEAVALQVQDVTLPNVRIRRALKWTPDGPRLVGATKTRRSNRTVVVGDVMLTDLKHACEGKAGTDLVFTAPRGGQVLHRTFWSRAWLPAVADLTPRPRIHDLRHSHASILLAAGVPIHVVQARLGHESIQTTVNTYSHLLPDAQVAAAAAADLAFGARPRELG
jgi:integrase